MKIIKKHINNINNYTGSIESGVTFRVCTQLLAQELNDKLSKAGFSIPISSGDCILPNASKSTSHFNANGKWNLLRNEKKESRYIRTIKWRWKQFSGRDSYEEVEDYRDIYRECYLRELITPPSIEITYLFHENKHLIISPILIKEPSHDKRNLHVINLFLELFGECDLVQEDLARFISIETRRVNWSMFPTGEQPWKNINGFLQNKLQRTSDNTKELILDRQKTICELGAHECYVGLGGFSDYIAYLFKDLNFVILESIQKDNAIYIFDKNWQEFSKLSKAEVLNHNYQRQRIIHSKDWKKKLKDSLRIEIMAEA
jgi:hypothetical protein